MWAVGPRRELRMELRSHKKRMTRKLDYFNKISFGVYAGKHKTLFLKNLPIFIVHFIAVAMAFQYLFCAVCFCGFGTGLYKASVFAKAH